MEFNPDGFQAVCPECSASFDLDESTIEKVFDDAEGEEYLKVTCPNCDYIKLIDVIEE